MAIYRHAGTKSHRERDVLDDHPLRVGDEIIRGDSHGAAFVRWYVAIALPDGGLGWLFVGKHVPCLDTYKVIPEAS